MKKLIIGGLVVMLAGDLTWANVVWTIPMTSGATSIGPRRIANWSGTNLVVAGDQTVGGNAESFRWSVTGGTVAMPAVVGSDTWVKGQTSGISNDGSVIAGVVYNADNTIRHAVKSINGGAWSYVAGSTDTSNINNISGNGYYAAGQLPYRPTEDAVRFDDLTGSTSYVVVPGTDVENAIDVNDSGAVVGKLTGMTSGTPYIYNGPHNPGTTLTFAEGMPTRPVSVSDSGDRIASNIYTGGVVTSIQLFDWDGSTYSSAVTISGLPGYTTRVTCAGMSHDGLRVAGQAFDASNNTQAYLWDNGTLMTWSEVTTKWGLTLPGTIVSLNSISADGNALTGTYTLSGTTYGFAALIPEPATLLLLALGGLAMMRRRR